MILGEVSGVDKDKRYVFVNNADGHGTAIPYDYLILATGGESSYFGNEQFS